MIENAKPAARDEVAAGHEKLPRVPPTDGHHTNPHTQPRQRIVVKEAAQRADVRSKWPLNCRESLLLLLLPPRRWQRPLPWNDRPT